VATAASAVQPEDDAASELGRQLRARGYGSLELDDPLVALLGRSVVTPVRSIEDELLATLTRLGLVRRRGEMAEPAVRLTAWDDLLLVHDPDDAPSVGPETVLGVNNTTRTLAHLTPRAPVGRALDVATGSGAIALLVRRHAPTVVATDLSERAVRYARLNAAMNLAALDCRVGDLFEPVDDDEPFDLVTANLPFVVSPDTEFTFRDGGRSGDALSRAAVVGASRCLAPAGLAVLLCNWIVPEGEEWTSPARAWATESGCDCVALHHGTEAPEAYARRWNEFLLAQDPAAFSSAVDRWCAAYETWGAAGIASGAIVLRRSDDRPPWFHGLEMASSPAGDGGSQLLRIVRNVDLLSTRGHDIVERVPLALVSPHRLEQAMAYDGSWSMQPGRMVLADTCGPVGEVDPLAIHVVLRLDGQTPLADICRSVAADTGLAVSDLTGAAEATCRRLLEAGCLEIAR
jgi:methylase of polypeptide subunit release factors